MCASVNVNYPRLMHLCTIASYVWMNSLPRVFTGVLLLPIKLGDASHLYLPEKKSGVKNRTLK